MLDCYCRSACINYKLWSVWCETPRANQIVVVVLLFRTKAFSPFDFLYFYCTRRLKSAHNRNWYLHVALECGHRGSCNRLKVKVMHGTSAVNVEAVLFFACFSYTFCSLLISIIVFIDTNINCIEARNPLTIAAWNGVSSFHLVLITFYQLFCICDTVTV